MTLVTIADRLQIVDFRLQIENLGGFNLKSEVRFTAARQTPNFLVAYNSKQ
jgi:hypothetical protein